MKLLISVRRMITKYLEIITIIVCILIFGNTESVVEGLLIYSQAFLSITLPFSIIPLTIFTNSKQITGEFVNKL